MPACDNHSATVVFGETSYNALWLSQAGTTLTLGAQVEVHGQTGTIGYSSAWGGSANVGVISEGTVLADVPGGTITINAQPFLNQGLMEDNGGVFALSGGYLNAGTFTASNGTISITGTLINSNQTLLVAGPVSFPGGVIEGGRIETTNGAALVVQSSLTLNGVTVNGRLDVGNSYSGASLTVTNGLTLNGTMLVGNPTNNWYGGVNFAGNQTLGGSATLVFGDTSYCCPSYNALWLSQAGTTLTLGGQVEVHGQSGTIGFSSVWGGSANVGVINEGTVLADVPGGTITIDAQPFSNQGVMEDNGGTFALGVSNINAGTFTASNGTISIAGTLINSNQTLLVAGPVSFPGGVIEGGMIETTNGAALVVQSSLTLNGVTVNGQLDVGNSYNAASLTVSNGLTLNGTMLVGNPTNNWYGGVDFAGSQTLGGSATVIFGDTSYCCPSYNALWLSQAGTTLTLGGPVEVHGQSGTIGYSSTWNGPANVSVISEGTILADVAGGTITINGQPFLNEGNLESEGGTFALAGTNVNQGVFNVSSGAIHVTGTLDNSSQTLVLDGATNLLNLQGATIRGGTVEAINGAALVVMSSMTLDGVTVNGTIDVGNGYNSVNLTVTNGLTLNGTMLVGNPTNSWTGVITFAGSQLLAGNGAVLFGNGYYQYNALLVAGSGATFIIAPGITIGGQSGTVGASSGNQLISIVNQGIISADGTSHQIYINAQPLQNNGGLLRSPAGFLNIGGTIAVGGLGSFLSSNGVMGLSGFLTNDDQVLTIPGPSNVLTMSGGTIHGGTVAATGSSSLTVSSGTLDGVTLQGMLDVGNSLSGAALGITNNLTLNGTALVGNPSNGWYGQMTFTGSQTLGGNGEVIFGSYGNPAYNAIRLASSSTALTIGPGMTVHGKFGTIGYSPAYGGPLNISVTNLGVISADLSGGTIVVDAQPFNSQEGLVQSPLGTLDLAGVVAPGALGNVESGAGTFALSGILTNTGQSLILPGRSNALTLQPGAHVFGGLIIATNGNALIINQGILDDVTVEGLLDVGNTVAGASLTITNNLTLNGLALLGNPSNNWYGAMTFAGSQQLSGAGTVIFGNASYQYNALRMLYDGETLVIAPGITVRGQNGIIGYGSAYGGPQDVTVVNQGVISADVGGGTILVQAQPFNNQTGLLQSPAGTLIVGGAMGAGQLGRTVSSNGTVELGATLTNDNQISVLPGTSNVLTLVSPGLIHGGTVVVTNGNSLAISSGTLDGVTVQGLLDVGNAINRANLVITNNLTLNGTALLGNPSNNWAGGIGFAGNETLGGNGTVVFGNGGNALYLMTPGTALTIGPGITIEGQTGTIGSPAGTGWPGNFQNVAVTNLGSILASVPGGTITINAQPFLNQGVIESPGGALNVGFLENAGQTLLAGTDYSSLALTGGTIHGGSVNMSNDTRLVIGNLTLDGVTLNGNLDVGNQFQRGALTVTNGLILNGTVYLGSSGNQSYGSIQFDGTQTLSGNGTVVFGGSGANALWVTVAQTGLVLGSNIMVRGQSGQIGYAPSGWGGPSSVSVTNQGTISIDVPGGTLYLNGTNFENDGLLAVGDGAALQSAVADFTNAGDIRIDLASASFSGSFAQASGTLDFGLGGPTGSGFVSFTGTARVAGSLAAHLEDNYLPAAGDAFAVINYGGNFVFFTNLDLPGPELWMTNYHNGTLSLYVTNGYQLGVSAAADHPIAAAGSDVIFTATVNQIGQFSFQWSYNGSDMVGATNSALQLKGVTKASSGAYRVAASTPFLVATSAPVQLTVLAPAIIQTPPQAVSAYVGADVAFNVSASGDAPLAYQWLFNGTPITWAAGPSLILNAVGRPQAGAYSVVVSNPAVAVTSAPVALTILAGPNCPDGPSGMVAWWRGEGNAYDYAGTNDLTFAEAAYGPGQVGRAFLFNGVSSYLTGAPGSLPPSGTNDFSIEFWTSLSSLAPSTMGGDGSVAFIARDEGLGDLNKWLFGFGGQTLYFYVNSPGLGPRFLAPAAFNPLTNQWYHLAVTRAGLVFRVYTNGALAASESNTLSIPPAAAPLTIAAAQGLFLPGLLDEISLYDRALSSSEIQAIYQSGSQGKCGGGGPAAQPLTLVNSGFTPGRQFQFQITGGAAGAIIDIQASSDLSHWSNLWQYTNTNPGQPFTDSNSISSRPRFYRAGPGQ